MNTLQSIKVKALVILNIALILVLLVIMEMISIQIHDLDPARLILVMNPIKAFESGFYAGGLMMLVFAAEFGYVCYKAGRHGL